MQDREILLVVKICAFLINAVYSIQMYLEVMEVKIMLQGTYSMARPSRISFLGLGLCWSGSGSGVSRNLVSTTDIICTRSKSEAERSSLKDDDLNSAAELSPASRR